jgi:transposase
MRGDDEHQDDVFSYVSMEQRIAQDHPLRKIRPVVDEALRRLDVWLTALYANRGRPSIAPEKLLRALLLQCLYSVRSERLLMEQLDYNLLFRWFVGLSIDDRVWDVTVFTKNRDRLVKGEVAQRFFSAVVEVLGEQGYLSDEHFTVDGTMIQAWANRRSFQEKPKPPKRGTGTRGRKQLRDTHESKTDVEARLFKRSAAGEARPSFMGHVISENRNGLLVRAMLNQSAQTAEREAGKKMMAGLAQPGAEITLGADKAYQEEEFVAECRRQHVIPHIAEYEPSKNFPNWLKPEERNHPWFSISQRKRKLVEQAFGWMKQIAGLRQTKLRGQLRVQWAFQLGAAAYNLCRFAGPTPLRQC